MSNLETFEQYYLSLNPIKTNAKCILLGVSPNLILQITANNIECKNMLKSTSISYIIEDNDNNDKNLILVILFYNILLFGRNKKKPELYYSFITQSGRAILVRSQMRFWSSDGG